MKHKISRFEVPFINSIFWFFIGLHIFYKIWLLLHSGFEYTDSDQGVLWLATKHFSEGIFIEPRFYGQDYNSSMEAFLAVPLFKLGLPLYQALPIISSLLASFPFFLLAFLCYSSGEKIAGILIVALSLCFPLTYDVLSNLPRGFVTGLAVASINFVLLFGNDKKWKWLLGGAISILALSLNPNSALLIGPVYLILVPRIWAEKKRILLLIVGALPFLILHYSLNAYYAAHPERLIHGYEMKFDGELFLFAFQNLDRYIGILLPFSSTKSWLFFLFPTIIGGWFFYKKKQALAIATISIPVLFTLTLLVSKVHDGNASAYFSVSRMFLAIPILWALLIRYLGPKKQVLILCLSTLVFLPIKAQNLDNKLVKLVEQNNVISVRNTDAVLKECKILNAFAAQYNADLILIDDYLYQDIIDYACMACEDSFPITLRPEYERKHWLLAANIKAVHKDLLLVTEPLDAIDSLRTHGVKLEYLENHIYHIYQNELPLHEIMKIAGIRLPAKLHKAYSIEYFP